MPFRRRTPPVDTFDAGLAAIDVLEQRFLLAHEQKIQNGVSPEEVARFRPDAVALAKAICDRMRADYAWSHR